MAPAGLLTRQETLSTLPDFASALGQAVNGCGLAENERAPMLCACVAARCAQCGITVTGQELLALAAGSTGDPENPKLARLRQGYCARDGCTSYHYQLQFTPYAGIDWSGILSAVEATMQHRTTATSGKVASTPGVRRRALRRVVMRVLIGLSAVLFLWLVRQWYLGGTVPWIREPENFQVDHEMP